MGMSRCLVRDFISWSLETVVFFFLFLFLLDFVAIIFAFIVLEVLLIAVISLSLLF